MYDVVLHIGGPYGCDVCRQAPAMQPDRQALANWPNGPLATPAPLIAASKNKPAVICTRAASVANPLPNSSISPTHLRKS
eukprot:scaffold70263_cov18-Tisochrysis_lutea.AAC.1